MPSLYNDDPPGYPYHTKTRADQWKEDREKAQRMTDKLQSLRKRDTIIAAVVGFFAGLAVCFL